MVLLPPGGHMKHPQPADLKKPVKWFVCCLFTEMDFIFSSCSRGHRPLRYHRYGGLITACIEDVNFYHTLCNQEVECIPRGTVNGPERGPYNLHLDHLCQFSPDVLDHREQVNSMENQQRLNLSF